MGDKSIFDLIVDRFGKFVQDDNLFDGISAELILSVRKSQGAIKIKEILGGEQNEDNET